SSEVQLTEREGLSYRDQCRYRGIDPLTSASTDSYLRDYDALSFSSEDVSSTASSTTNNPELECKHRELLCTAAGAAAEAPATGGSGDSHTEKILVRGGLFEADIAARSCRPIYWSAVSELDWRGKPNRMPKSWRKSTQNNL
uniref:IRS-type PTB domain-containing protein n=1 Tax=Macrostomum lignano TaxID=282301 RepID=A0A1I8H2R0_9PLAT